jgi:serine/threonine protein phosphatase 1
LDRCSRGERLRQRHTKQFTTSMFNLFQKHNNKPRQIAIGDIHGHYDGMRQLVNFCDLKGQDRLYFLGDVIDRGPKSAQVVQWIQENKHPCLMGNHEIMLLHSFNDGDLDEVALRHWLPSGGNTTLASYGDEGIPQSDIDWFASLPSYLDLGDFFLVHAGVDPFQSIDKQNNEQFCWIREKFFSSQFAYFPSKTIVTGHTITFTLPGVSPGEVAQGPGWINIETGAYHRKSGWMTALDMTNGIVYQVNVFTNKQRKRNLDRIAKEVEPNKVKL